MPKLNGSVTGRGCQQSTVRRKGNRSNWRAMVRQLKPNRSVVGIDNEHQPIISTSGDECPVWTISHRLNRGIRKIPDDSSFGNVPLDESGSRDESQSLCIG